MISGDGLFAIKVVAAAAPVAGFAAVVHVRARRRARRRHQAAIATAASRELIVDVAPAAGDGFVAVRFELTPHLTQCLTAAKSAALRGFETPDAVMMALDIEATWTTGSADTVAQPVRTRAIATREVLVLRASGPARESVKVDLKQLLRAHGATAETRPLYCLADGEIVDSRVRRIHAAPAAERRQFYWVRSREVPTRPANSAATPRPSRSERP